jgi:hypothetical protein
MLPATIETREHDMSTQNTTSSVLSETGFRPSLRDGWRSIGDALRRVRDWPDPDSPYSPFLTVLVAASFVLFSLAFR